jgi:CMP-N-acetylneuraminic acid synthetase
MSAIGIVYARAGSKRLPGKNVRLLCGKPLICWSIEQGLESKLIDEVIVTSESTQILDIAAQYPEVSLFERDPSLAEDHIGGDAILVNVLENIDKVPDLTVTLQPTCPIRPPGHIDKAIELLLRTNADSVFTVHKGPNFVWSIPYDEYGLPHANLLNCSLDRRKPGQFMAPYEQVWVENGNIYVTKSRELLRTGMRVTGTKNVLKMASWDGVDIDTAEDFAMAEFRMGQQVGPPR